MARFIRLKPIGVEGVDGLQILPKEDYEAYLTARSIIEKAEERAKAIKEEAKKAYLEEKEKGYQAGIDEAQEKTMAQMIETIEKTIDFFENSEGILVELIELSLKKIMAKIPSEEIIVGIVRSALEHVRNQKQVTISVSPEEVSVVKQHIAEITEGYNSLNYIDVEPDPRLGKGDCIIQSDMGIIDASLSKQLANLSKAFEKTLGTRKKPIIKEPVKQKIELEQLEIEKSSSKKAPSKKATASKKAAKKKVEKKTLSSQSSKKTSQSKTS